ncbi:MAG: hypothetical protein A2622_11865 [Bdellovibrionales bacterium RIFCSPHIGHO2_01_FULL_40_29]|nr:MAG: hypothetical protein A2622_11865 [Bdellovibrionales bacterium RIFCSPHIGHO2_01_FULL_40_29]OFZ35302.1 MAG: hypothetical protein A3D17_08860 [Bdellovibrionales bacterium RIFCSPHIGHO2_02_FULL_40_15]
MKNALLFCLTLFTFSANSQTVNIKLLKNIASAVNALHEDTINEGQMTAYVGMVNGRPEMQCDLARFREEGKGLAKCNISFNIKSEYTGESENCSNECFLIHVYDLKTLQVLDRVESLSQSCIESLSSGCD